MTRFFNKIMQLETGQAVDLGGVTITLNINGLYELESVECHECFMSRKQLYDGVSKYFSSIELHAGE